MGTHKGGTSGQLVDECEQAGGLYEFCMVERLTVHGNPPPGDGRGREGMPNALVWRYWR